MKRGDANQKKVACKEKNNDKNGKTDYGKAEYYYNRELSWLLFDKRVLSEAQDEHGLEESTAMGVSTG